MRLILTAFVTIVERSRNNSITEHIRLHKSQQNASNVTITIPAQNTAPTFRPSTPTQATTYAEGRGTYPPSTF